MEITKSREGGSLCIRIAGRLDTTTAPRLEEAVREELAETASLEIDLAETEYISSAGLRVFLEASKTMRAKEGLMTVRNVNEQVMDIFKVTGFDRILKIV